MYPFGSEKQELFIWLVQKQGRTQPGKFIVCGDTGKQPTELSGHSFGIGTSGGSMFLLSDPLAGQT